ncbi:hypothetical protein BJ741DRAFT_627777 [Chytriomyces cf. hyalinus JEL632]|nr:hypothetical protein BJ741DRAFT_627777 [Chytriomyces cf. hyalinus JEL632]
MPCFFIGFLLGHAIIQLRCMPPSRQLSYSERTTLSCQLICMTPSLFIMPARSLLPPSHFGGWLGCLSDFPPPM